MPTSELVTLTSGLAVPLSALELLWSLEARGFALRLVRGGDAIAIWAGSYDLSDPPTPADLQRLATEAAQAIRSKLSDEVRPK